MGITIHFEGRLKHSKAYPLLLDELEELSDRNRWPRKLIEDAVKTLHRVRDEKDWDYIGRTFGLVLQPDENSDPLRFEFDEEFYGQEFIKTQFAGTDVHIAVIELFRRIEPYFYNLSIFDEGEFWETSDVNRLAQHIEKCNKALQEILEKDPKARGPVRLADGRIVDLVN